MGISLTTELAVIQISSRELLTVSTHNLTFRNKYTNTCTTVFGMSADLSGFLTVLGGTIDGDGLTWSIGGPSKANSGISSGGLLGVPQGISGSHNKYESDASPSRGDLYLDGNDFTLQMDQYQQLYDAGQANGDVYDLPLLTDFRSQRFDHSVQNNPYFFNGELASSSIASSTVSGAKADIF